MGRSRALKTGYGEKVPGRHRADVMSKEREYQPARETVPVLRGRPEPATKEFDDTEKETQYTYSDSWDTPMPTAKSRHVNICVEDRRERSSTRVRRARRRVAPDRHDVRPSTSCSTLKSSRYKRDGYQNMRDYSRHDFPYHRVS